MIWAMVVVLLAQDPSIIAPGAKLERLFGEGFFTEGPAPAPDGSVYFSDITVGKGSGYQAGYIWRWDPRTDMKTGKSVILAALFDGRPFNSPNDLVLDARGRIYFTDPRYVGWEPIEQPVQGVYRIDPDGRVSLVVADAGKPNGIAVSPDQATLYVGANDNGALGDLPPETPAAPGRKALLAYDLAPDGSARFRRAVVDFSPAGPDGITVDREGNIYCAVQGERQGIYAYSPAGKELGYIPMPESPTNVKFGRAGDAQTLFITAGKSLYRIRVERTGVSRE